MVLQQEGSVECVMSRANLCKFASYQSLGKPSCGIAFANGGGWTC